MTVDKNLLNRVIYKTVKNGVTGTLIQDRLFEREDHNIPELAATDFTGVDVKPLVASASENNDKLLTLMDEGEGGDWIYASITSSQIYHLLLNLVKIPTNTRVTNEQTKLYTCQISLKNPDDVISNRLAFNFLCFVGLPLEEKLVIEQDVFEYLQGRFSTQLNIEVLSESEVHYKKATLDLIDNPMDVVSVTHQESFSKRCREVLLYKATNPDTALDNSKLDNLQFFLIEQQLCFGMYMSLQPVLDHSIVKFNRIRKISDHTGNLFFSLMLPQKPLNGEDHLTLRDIVLILLEYGFFISHADIERNIEFKKDARQNADLNNLDNILLDRESKSEQLGKNAFYSLLFRLLDDEIGNNLLDFDDLILNKKYDKFQLDALSVLS